MNSYSDKLKSPKWQKKRLEILNLIGFKCELCGCEEKELHVHHRFYLKGREVWQYDNDVFQVLCFDCHEKEHKKEPNIIEVIPEKHKELIQEISYLKNEDIQNLMFFLQNTESKEEMPELLRLFANAANSGWFYSAIEFIKDKESIESLNIEIFLLKNKLKEIFPDLN